MKHFAFALAVLISTSAMAADGTTKFSIQGTSATYEMSLLDNKVEGSIYGFNDYDGKIEIKQTAKGWSGRLGFVSINVEASQPNSKGVVTVSARTLPGGFHTYYVKYDANKGRYSISGYNAQSDFISGRVEKEATDMNIANDNISLNLKRDAQNATMFKGSIFIRERGSFPTTYPATLSADGMMNPGLSVKDDPALFVITNVLPFNI